VDLPAQSFDLEAVRTPLAATINEVQFADKMPFLEGFIRSPIHRFVRIRGTSQQFVREEEGLAQAVELTPVKLERSYTGEAHSIAQKDYLPLELAAGPLLAITSKADVLANSQDEHRVLTAERFAASYQAAPDWLQVLFLVLAGRFGTPEMIPELVRIARQRPEPAAGSRREHAREDHGLGCTLRCTGHTQGLDAGGCGLRA
jgi:hypothetical protein